jgi:selenophosphate synthase
LKTRRSPNQRVISPDREKIFLDAVKISAENGRIRAFNSICDVIEDYADARMAFEAESNGMLSVEETKKVLDKYRMLD